MKWYPYLEVMAKRPKAIKYTRFFNELPLMWKNYLESQDRERKKLTITALMKMMEGDDEEGLINATRALEETLRRGVSDIDSVLVTYYRIKNQGSPIKEIEVPDSVPPVKEYQVDIGVYDSLYRKEIYP